MKDAIEVINILEDAGYESYIVGGAVRDLMLKIIPDDFDITTEALPKQIEDLFGKEIVEIGPFLVTNLTYNGKVLQLTTFRKDGKYSKNRTPVSYKAVKRVKKDLRRRDFTINTILMDRNRELIDIFHGAKDLDAKIIKTVQNPRKTFQTDALRILRAIRFATIYDFEFEEKTEKAIKDKACLVKKLSPFRKREELFKIFLKGDITKAVYLLKKYKLDQCLEINNLKPFVKVDSEIGLFAQLDINLDDWDFTKEQRKKIIALKNLLIKEKLDIFDLINNGFDIFSLAVIIKGEPADQVMKQYQKLTTRSIDDLDVTSKQISDIFDGKSDNMISDIKENVFKEVVRGNVENEFKKIRKYIITSYK